MNFDRAPVLKRKEQGPDPQKVEAFVVPIKRFIEGDKQAIEILRGVVDKKERQALRLAVAKVQEGLGKRYESAVGRGVGTVSSMEKINARETKTDTGFDEKLVRLETLKEQLAFAA